MSAVVSVVMWSMVMHASHKLYKKKNLIKFQSLGNYILCSLLLVGDGEMSGKHQLALCKILRWGLEIKSQNNTSE